MKVLVAVPEKGFDPTELGVPCKLLRDRGVDIVVMSPSGTTPVRADPIMVDGVGLYLLKWSMRADPNGIAAYTEILKAGLLEKPLSYAAVLRHGRCSSLPFAVYDALLLPGGHCPDSLAESLAPLFAACKLPTRFHWGREYWGSTYSMSEEQAVRQEGDAEGFDGSAFDEQERAAFGASGGGGFNPRRQQKKWQPSSH